MTVAEVSVSAKLRLPCSGPEVKGYSAYLTPTFVVWTVSAHAGLATYVRAAVHGTGRNGELARGALLIDLEGMTGYREPDAVPDWLDGPWAWIDQARTLARAGFAAATGEGDGR